MSFEAFLKKLHEQVQKLKGEYEKEVGNLSTIDPFPPMVASKVKHLEEWGRYNNLVVTFRLNVNRRLREVDKLIGIYELGKIEPKNVWERYLALVPKELEELARSLEINDILSRIYDLHKRLVAVDQKKNPVPAKDTL